MQARETMTRRVLIAPPELSLAQAWSIMERHRIRHLPVAAGGTLLGIASDRDLLLLARTTKQGTLEFDGQRIAEAMTPSPVTCEPTTSVAELARVMTERKIDAIPVLDAVDRLVGLVTSTDLMLLLIEQEEARHPVPFRFELVEAAALAA